MRKLGTNQRLYTYYFIDIDINSDGYSYIITCMNFVGYCIKIRVNSVLLLSYERVLNDSMVYFSRKDSIILSMWQFTWLFFLFLNYFLNPSDIFINSYLFNF